MPQSRTQIRKAALAVREHAKATVAHEVEPPDYGEVTQLDPLLVELAHSSHVLDDEQLVLSQEVRWYDVWVGLKVGDALKVSRMPNGDWLAEGIVSDEETPFRGLPPGGDLHDVLWKESPTDFDVGWGTLEDIADLLDVIRYNFHNVGPAEGSWLYVETTSGLGMEFVTDQMLLREPGRAYTGGDDFSIDYSGSVYITGGGVQAYTKGDDVYFYTNEDVDSFSGGGGGGDVYWYTDGGDTFFYTSAYSTPNGVDSGDFYFYTTDNAGDRNRDGNFYAYFGNGYMQSRSGFELVDVSLFSNFDDSERESFLSLGGWNNFFGSWLKSENANLMLGQAANVGFTEFQIFVGALLNSEDDILFVADGTIDGRAGQGVYFEGIDDVPDSIIDIPDGATIVLQTSYDAFNPNVAVVLPGDSPGSYYGGMFAVYTTSDEIRDEIFAVEGDLNAEIRLGWNHGALPGMTTDISIDTSGGRLYGDFDGGDATFTDGDAFGVFFNSFSVSSFGANFAAGPILSPGIPPGGVGISLYSVDDTFGAGGGIWMKDESPSGIGFISGLATGPSGGIYSTVFGGGGYYVDEYGGGGIGLHERDGGGVGIREDGGGGIAIQEFGPGGSVEINTWGTTSSNGGDIFIQAHDGGAVFVFSEDDLVTITVGSAIFEFHDDGTIHVPIGGGVVADL